MPNPGSPLGHPNRNLSKDPKCNGGALGYLGKQEDKYSIEELHELGRGLVEWIQQKGNIWCNYYYAVKGISKTTIRNLRARFPFFDEYNETAKNIQEAKLLSEPYHKKADGNHARFMLARHHKGEWEDKAIVVNESDIKKVQETMDLVNYLQEKADKESSEEHNDQSEEKKEQQ